jgi:hypothetical protein
MRRFAAFGTGRRLGAVVAVKAQSAARVSWTISERGFATRVGGRVEEVVRDLVEL